MELWYELVVVYTPDENRTEQVRQLAQDLVDSGYVEDDDVTELAKETNSVISIEVEQDDGYMEFVLSNNLGEIKYREIFSLDLLERTRQKIKEVGVENYFTKTDLKSVDIHCREHDISRVEFVRNYLDEYMLDKYEEKKNRMVKRVDTYYKK